MANTAGRRVRKRQCHLARGRIVRLGDLGEHPAARRPRTDEAVMPERAVGDDGDAVRLAPRHDGVLDGALLQMVEHLVAGDAAVAGDRPCLVQVVRRRNC